ncbi:RES domain-containing protein [Methylorubrum extorquens]|nr:RES domain-containing protein [Methylorubrum extorquens]
MPHYVKIQEVEGSNLDHDWIEDGSRGWNVCRPLGNAWLVDGDTAVLKVPSAARLGHHNFLLNPVHRSFDDINIEEVIDQPFPGFCTREE